MSTTQRRWHASVWVAVAIATAAVLALAWDSRIAVPPNAELPTVLSTAPTSKGG